MKVKKEARTAQGTRFSVVAEGAEAGRAYLYLMNNDLHDEPFGLLEDVYVEEKARGSGVGSLLVREVISAA
jgi:GNAT superfamily N-acetyltransferase